MNPAAHDGDEARPRARAERIGPWLAQIARERGEQSALAAAGPEAAGPWWSYAELDRASGALADDLHALGLRAGDAVAIWLPNRPEWLVAHFAATRLGLLTVPLNTWYRDSEVAHFVGLARCRAVLVDSSFRGIDFDGILGRALAPLAAAGRQHVRWIIDWHAATMTEVPGWPREVRRVQVQSLSPHGPPAPVPSAANESAIVYATSGTTSAPKLAAHAESVLLAHAAAVARRGLFGPEDVVLGALPPCGAYGYGLLMASLMAGARAVTVEAFEVDRAVDIIATHGVTVAALTEPIVRRLLDHPGASRERLSSLRQVFSAGATLAPVVERAEREFGFRLTNVYGSSECLALAAFWDEGVVATSRGAAGGRLVSDGMEVRVADTDGRILAPGQEGELQFRGPAITRGYFGDPDATARAHTADGWFRSQDLGRIVDAGRSEFHYIARMNDAMRLKGFLVSPGEIEAMLQQHPAVAAAQVVGVPSADGDELAAAFVILRAGASADPEALRQFCLAHMASYKVPALLELLDAFPLTRSANGDKVMKNQLREMAKGRLCA